MAVLLKSGAVFLHVPKTGGSWVTRVLTDLGLVEKQFGHIHADMVRVSHYAGAARVATRGVWEWGKSLVPVKLKAVPLAQRLKHAARTMEEKRRPFCFCFVRHPLDWYESWWRYMCGRAGTDWSAETDLQGWHPCHRLRSLGDGDFNVFMRQVLESSPGFATELFGWYTQVGIDFVGRQENLANDLMTVLRHLNVPFDEEKVIRTAPVNVGRHHERPLGWDPDVRQLARQLEWAGMVRYGYEETNR